MDSAYFVVRLHLPVSGEQQRPVLRAPVQSDGWHREGSERSEVVQFDVPAACANCSASPSNLAV